MCLNWELVHDYYVFSHNNLRYKWKVDLIERIKNSVNEPPAVLGDCVSQKQFFDQTEPYRGQRVLLTGKFDHSRGDMDLQLSPPLSLLTDSPFHHMLSEVFLGLRTAPPSLTGGPAKGMASNPQVLSAKQSESALIIIFITDATVLLSRDTTW